MKSTARAFIVLLSAGWIVPFCLAHWISQRLMSDAIVPAVREGKVWVGAIDPLPYIDGLFYFSMAWLAAVIVAWCMHLTPPKDR